MMDGEIEGPDESSLAEDMLDMWNDQLVVKAELSSPCERTGILEMELQAINVEKCRTSP